LRLVGGIAESRLQTTKYLQIAPGKL